tara:strand:- start:473 stop:991 length:519 start_codon:yes stop_codon:yes gene_type:complete
MSSELRVDKIMPIDGIGNDTSHGHGAGNTSVQYGGGIIQVVQSLREGQLEQSFSSATTVMSATITPKFSTSKILIQNSTTSCGSRDTSTHYELYFNRNSTRIHTVGTYIGLNLATDVCFPSAIFMDSPATTSPVTYNLMALRKNGSANCYFNLDNGGSEIHNAVLLLMEVSA